MIEYEKKVFSLQMLVKPGLIKSFNLFIVHFAKEMKRLKRTPVGQFNQFYKAL